MENLPKLEVVESSTVHASGCDADLGAKSLMRRGKYRILPASVFVSPKARQASSSSTATILQLRYAFCRPLTSMASTNFTNLSTLGRAIA